MKCCIPCEHFKRIWFSYFSLMPTRGTFLNCRLLSYCCNLLIPNVTLLPS
nr:MAG TPA: hypothetical protein [Caudoviricetes sp.]